MNLYWATVRKDISRWLQPSESSGSNSLEKFQLTLFHTPGDALTASSSQGTDDYPVITVEFNEDSTDASLPSADSNYVIVPAWKIKYLNGALNEQQTQEIHDALQSAQATKNEYDKLLQSQETSTTDVLGEKRKQAQADIQTFHNMIERLNDIITTYAPSQQLSETISANILSQQNTLALLTQELERLKNLVNFIVPPDPKISDKMFLELNGVIKTYKTLSRQAYETLSRQAEETLSQQTEEIILSQQTEEIILSQQTKILDSLLKQLTGDFEVSNSVKSGEQLSKSTSEEPPVEEPSAKTSSHTLLKHGVELATSLGVASLSWYLGNSISGTPLPSSEFFIGITTASVYLGIQGTKKFINSNKVSPPQQEVTNDSSLALPESKVSSPQQGVTNNSSLALPGSNEPLSNLSKRNSDLLSSDAPQVKRQKQDLDNSQPTTTTSKISKTPPKPITPQLQLQLDRSANDPKPTPTDTSRNTPKIIKTKM